MSCSGADLDTMRGFMKGSLQMAVLGEEHQQSHGIVVVVPMRPLVGVSAALMADVANCTDENDRVERRFDAIVAPFNLIGNAHQVLHMSDEDEDDADKDWDSDQP